MIVEVQSSGELFGVEGELANDSLTLAVFFVLESFCLVQSPVAKQVKEHRRASHLRGVRFLSCGKWPRTFREKAFNITSRVPIARADAPACKLSLFG